MAVHALGSIGSMEQVVEVVSRKEDPARPPGGDRRPPSGLAHGRRDSAKAVRPRGPRPPVRPALGRRHREAPRRLPARRRQGRGDAGQAGRIPLRRPEPGDSPAGPRQPPALTGRDNLEYDPDNPEGKGLKAWQDLVRKKEKPRTPGSRPPESGRNGADRSPEESRSILRVELERPVSRASPGRPSDAAREAGHPPPGPLRQGRRPGEAAGRPRDRGRFGQPAADRRDPGRRPSPTRPCSPRRMGSSPTRQPLAVDRRPARRHDQLRPRLPVLVRLDRARASGELVVGVIHNPNTGRDVRGDPKGQGASARRPTFAGLDRRPSLRDSLIATGLPTPSSSPTPTGPWSTSGGCRSAPIRSGGRARRP